MQQKVTCNATACTGSLMRGLWSPPRAAGDASNLGPEVGAKSENASRVDEIYSEARDLITQMYTDLKYDNQKLEHRLREVDVELRERGTYTQTASELLYGAKQAWRNASRCIGRIQFNKLALNDARHLTTTRQMFDSLCEHIRKATNGGNIQSTITVFAPCAENEPDLKGSNHFRIWNHQLIAYAGYELDDDDNALINGKKIIGDPARVEFTKVCQKLGWRPPAVRGPFDILPVRNSFHFRYFKASTTCMFEFFDE